MERTHGTEDVRVARQILDWAKENTDDIWWGKGSIQGSFLPLILGTKRWYSFIAIWTYGNIEFQFQHMRKWKPFDKVEKQEELLHRLNQIPGVSFTTEDFNRRPSVPLAVFQENDNLNHLFSIFEWVIEKYKSE